MKQYCPQCQQWYKSTSRYCPDCDIIMYTKDSYADRIHRNKKLKIRTRKKIKITLFIGIIFIAASIILTAVSLYIVFIADTIEANKIIIETICIIGILLSTVLFITGVCFGLKYIYYNKRIQLSPKAPNIQCPYCRSKLVSRITTFDRTISIITFGLVSNKFGKQWHCDDCDSNF